MRESVDKRIESYEKDMVNTLKEMISTPAISPESGGEGESKRADFLERVLRSWGFDPRRFDYIDEHGAKRSNIVVSSGNKRKLWIVCHIDTVSPGNLDLWKSNPFEAKVEDGRIYGRGACDNGQSVVGAMYALRALREEGESLENIGVALVADEELGSKYGISKLIEEGIFGKDDMVLVPDWGNERGDEIEIAEKSILWLKIKVEGKQAHGSTPEKGINAFRHMISFLSKADELLNKKYGYKYPPFGTGSTFEMTKHEKNVDSVNIIPGIEVAYMDCRILPKYSIDEIIDELNELAKGEALKGARITIEPYVREDAPEPTSESAEVVSKLKDVLKRIRGIDAKCVGIGGGTCASFFRKKGMSAAVWSTIYDVAHEPNEFCEIKNMVEDSKVFAHLAFES
ncbi:MAG: M20 family metallo-hydrolase [Candidatus Micrarchaeaceae archaeon]